MAVRDETWARMCLGVLRSERCDAGRVCGAVRRADRAAARSLGHLSCPAAIWVAAEEKSLRAAEQNRPDVAAAREVWHSELAGIAPERLVFLDESGLDTRLIRTHQDTSLLMSLAAVSTKQGEVH
jgi:hypothetical protein